MDDQARPIYPRVSDAPLPNPDLPEDVLIDYSEAASIYHQSPRGAIALLRLALQKLLIHLGCPGKNLNQDIGSYLSDNLDELEKRGINPAIQKALDSVRIVGNSAVHPIDNMDLRVEVHVARMMFVFLNQIVCLLISNPREIDEFYNSLPEGPKENIKHRDKKKG